MNGHILGPVEDLQTLLDEAEQDRQDMVARKIDLWYKSWTKSLLPPDAHKSAGKDAIEFCINNWTAMGMIGEIHPSIASCCTSLHKHFPTHFPQSAVERLTQNLTELAAANVGKLSQFALAPMSPEEAGEGPQIITPPGFEDRNSKPDTSNPYEGLTE